jgi:hypothetical protein
MKTVEKVSWFQSATDTRHGHACVPKRPLKKVFFKKALRRAGTVTLFSN